MAKSSYKPNENYLQYVSNVTPKTKQMKRLSSAFLVGGLICIIGQGVSDIVKAIAPALPVESVGAITSAVMIFLGALLTGIGIYDRIGGFAGAGSIVPITGFANSVVSPAIEYRSEGFVYGVAAKMFSIAGPIIVNGVTLSVVVGIIYYLIYLI